MRQMLALSTEALLKVLLRDETRVVNIKMMEGEGHVGLSDGSPTINGHGQELRVVDLTIVIEVDALENLIYFILWHVQLIKSSSNLRKLKSARVVRIERSERVSQLSEIKSARIDLVDQEGESSNLEPLGLTEVLDTAEYHELVLVQKCWVVSSMIL